MPKSICGLFFLILFFSCSSLHENNAWGVMPATSEPGSCRIEGRIVGILKPGANDSGSICAQYPCRAKVVVLNVFGCGAGVSMAVHEGDTVEMKFAYTLHSTEIFPDMKVHFPGLKKGDKFKAIAKQQLVMGGNSEFVIFDYTVK